MATVSGVDVLLLVIAVGFGLLWLREANKTEAAGKALAAMGERLNEVEHANADAQQMLADTRTMAEQWMDVFAQAADFASRPLEREPTVVSKEQYDRLISNHCQHCGGSHAVACPRVKRIRFKADGMTPEEVEFWADDQWSRDRVVFPEDLLVVEEAT